MGRAIYARQRTMNNFKYSQTDYFIKKCEEFGIKPTTRQASKFCNKRGRLFQCIQMTKGTVADVEKDLK